MLKAYLDRAEKTSATDAVMCVACTVFKEIGYKKFTRPWNRMLRRWGATAFHATDFYPGGGEFRRNTPQRKKWFEDDSRAIPSMIGENVARVMCVAFRPKEFAEKASPEWIERFGTDTHAMAAQLCAVFNGLWLEEKSPSESFAYVQESGDESEGKVAEAIRRMREAPDYASVIRIKSFTSAAKGTARGLEAADFVAWHWNKHVIERLSNGLEPRKDFAAFGRLTEPQGKVQTAFITGEKLETFFNTLEQAVRDNLKADDANAKAKAARGNA